MRGGIEPPQGPEHHLKSGVARTPRGKISRGTKEIEASMATRQQRQPVETPTQAR
jgi:hypothetical protein